VIITIGFTQSDRDRGYSSFCDGFHAGAKQERVSVWIPAPLEAHSLEEVAEATFIATNHPDPASLTGLAGEVFQAVETFSRKRERYFRSLSVGDTVRTADGRLACVSEGWEQMSDGSVETAWREAHDEQRDRFWAQYNTPEARAAWDAWIAVPANAEREADRFHDQARRDRME
jgi:hypothetical protein